MERSGTSPWLCFIEYLQVNVRRNNILNLENSMTNVENYNEYGKFKEEQDVCSGTSKVYDYVKWWVIVVENKFTSS